MMNRRTVLVGAALGGVAGCNQSRPRDTHAEIIWVTLSPTQSGYQALLNDESVEPENLDAAVLALALEANPGFTEQEARAEALIAIKAEPDTPGDAVADAMRRLRFERVAFIAEDRRS